MSDGQTTAPDRHEVSIDRIEASPTSPAERIGIIDAIRGFALFGVLVANMPGFVLPAAIYLAPEKLFPDAVDKAAIAVIHTLVQGKFMTMFSVLFGVGFAVQMDRFASVGRFRRRLAVLAAIGLTHALLIWWGDILLLYALTGFVLVAFRKRSQKTAAAWALALGVIPSLLLIATGAAVLAGIPVPRESFEFLSNAEAARPAIEHYRSSETAVRFAQNARDWGLVNKPTLFVMFLFVLPRFLAGLWLWRTGVFRRPADFSGTIRRVWVASAVVSLAAAVVLLSVHDRTSGGPLPIATVVRNLAGEAGVAAMASFYGSSLLLLAARGRQMPSLAAVGRMALTNYLIQSFVLTWAFYLTGLYGRVGPAALVPIACCFFAVQIPLSRWWLSRYRFGPAEWLWRSLTYGRMQPMV